MLKAGGHVLPAFWWGTGERSIEINTNLHFIKFQQEWIRL